MSLRPGPLLLSDQPSNDDLPRTLIHRQPIMALFNDGNLIRRFARGGEYPLATLLHVGDLIVLVALVAVLVAVLVALLVVLDVALLDVASVVTVTLDGLGSSLV